MTLTIAAAWTRRGIVAFVIMVILGILGGVGYNIWNQYRIDTMPPIEEKPDTKFGNLPAITIPSSNSTSSNFSYSLDTITGDLPQTPKIMKVFFIPKANVSLMSPEKAKELAESLGFPKGPEVLSTAEYRYTDDKNGELMIEISSGNFRFQRPMTAASAIIKNATPLDRNRLIQDFKEYLATKNLLTDELRAGEVNVTFNTPNPQDSIKADVSILPEKIDNIPIVTAHFSQGLVRATLTNSTVEQTKFIDINYTVWPIDKTTFSTYPLKTADQAFTELKSGKGFVTLEPSSSQVSISSVYLAYYESEEYLPYLQPVFVFEGPDFTALVPAVQFSTN